MIKCYTEQAAEHFAAEQGQEQGRSIFDGCWYVGTRAQLDRVGVPNPNMRIVAAKDLAKDGVR